LRRIAKVTDDRRWTILLETLPLTMVVINDARASPQAWYATKGVGCSTRQPSLCGEESGGSAAMHSMRVARVAWTGKASGIGGAARP
jgi:hypothetical protein